MRKQIRSATAIGAAILILAVSGFAQYNRRDVADIARDVSNLAQNTWNTLRGDLDRQDPVGVRGPDGMALYLAISGFAGSARVYSDIASRYRNDAVLTGGARYLVDQARQIDGLMERTGALEQFRSDWSRVQEAVGRLSDSYSLSYSPTRTLPRSGSGRDPYPDRYGYGNRGRGSFRWHGLVDGSDYINLQWNRVTIDHLESNPIRNANFSLPQPLPRSNVQVQLNKIRGRGNVELVEQPSAYNDFTATVLIEDADPGADEYDFELTW